MRVDEKPDYTPSQRGDTYVIKNEKSRCNEQLEKYSKNVSPSGATLEEPVLPVDTTQNPCISGDTMTHCDTFFNKSVREGDIEKVTENRDKSGTLSPVGQVVDGKGNELTLQVWKAIGDIRFNHPPDKYKFSKISDAQVRISDQGVNQEKNRRKCTSYCLYKGCVEPALKDIDGMFGLCQRHLREYQALYEKEHPEAK
jgi:hypothetical protein